MTIGYLIIAILLMVGGGFLIFAPKLIIKFSESLNRWATTDDVILYKRHLVGIIIMLISVYMIYVYFQLPE